MFRDKMSLSACYFICWQRSH